MSVQHYLSKLINTPSANNPEGALRPAIADVLLPETVQPNGAGTPAFALRLSAGSAAAGDWVVVAAAGTRHNLAGGNADIFRLPDTGLRDARLGALNATALQAMREKLASHGLPVNFDNASSYRAQLDAAIAHYRRAPTHQPRG